MQFVNVVEGSLFSVTRLSRYSVYKDPQHAGLHESEINSLRANAQTLQIESRDVGKVHLVDGTGLRSSII